MFLYACFCMEAMLLIEYEGLMANENYLQSIIMPTDLTLNYHENHASPKDMTEVPKIHNQTTIIMATANIHKIIKTQAMKETHPKSSSTLLKKNL